MDPQKSRFMAIARVIKPQGRRGEVAAEITTDFPGRFQKLSSVFIAYPDPPHGPNDPGNPDGPDEYGALPRSVALEGAWAHKGRIVLKLAGIDSIDQAESLRGLQVMIPYEERVALPPGAYYIPELEGCRVVTGARDARIEVGTVTAVEPTGGVPVLHVSQRASAADGFNEILIPLAQEICLEIDTVGKLIVIDPPEDLLELNAKAAGKPKIGSRE